MSFRKITARDNPETLDRVAAQYEEHLRLAIDIALRRATRSNPLVRELLTHAAIEGLATRLNAKVAAVSFAVPQLQQTWHQLIPWQYLARNTPAETATSIAWSLRENVRRGQLIDTKSPGTRRASAGATHPTGRGSAA